MWKLLPLAIFSLAIIPGLVFSIRCYECKNFETCEKIRNATNKEKDAFKLDCNQDSKGCLRGIKFKDGSNGSVIESEIMNCYNPVAEHEYLSKKLKMNDCVHLKEGQWERFYCVCNKTDYCLNPTANETRGGGEDENGGGTRVSWKNDNLSILFLAMFGVFAGAVQD